jgi:hypothetical protein
MAITKATASSIAPAAKGNLVVGSATNDAAVLAVGANGTILTADSAEATGVKWAAAAGSTTTLSLITSGTLTSGTSITLSSLSNYDTLQLVVNDVDPSASSGLRVKLNNNGGSLYRYTYFSILGSGTAASVVVGGQSLATTLSLSAYENLNPTTVSNGFTFTFENCKAAGFTNWFGTAYVIDASGSTSDRGENQSGIFIDASTISSLVLTLEGVNTFQAGNYFLYGG